MNAKPTMRRLGAALTSATLAGTLLAAAPTAAQADPPPGGPIVITSAVSCTVNPNEPTVYWNIYNPNPVATTLGHVEAWPTAVGEYPVRVPAYGSVTGVQRPGKYATYAGISLHATFDDLTLTKKSAYTHIRSC